MVYALELGRELRLRAGVAARDEDDEVVAHAEGLVYEHGVAAVVRALVRLAVAVEEVGPGLGEVAGHDQQQHEYERRYAYGDEESAEAAARPHELAVRGPVQQLHTGQGQGRQENHDGYVAEHDALDQVETEVRAYAEAHEHQRHEAEERRRRAGRDGGKALAYREAHGLGAVRHLLAVPPEAVEEEDCVVQTDGQLHYGTHALRHEAYLAEYGVRAHVYDDRDAYGHEEEEGAYPARGREQEYKYRDRHHDDQDADDLADHVVLHARGVGRVAAHGPVGAGYLVYRRDGLALKPLVYRDVVERRAVLPVLLEDGLVHELHRRREVLRVVQPHDARDARRLCEALLHLHGLRQRQVPHHDARVRHARAELGVHQVQRRRALRVLGQIVGEVVVHPDAQDEHGGDYCGRGEKGYHNPLVPCYSPG